MKTLILTALFLFLTTPLLAAPTVVMKTNLGEVSIELNEAKAPESVKNFLTYVDAGFYDGTIFHRVIKGFMIQGGGYDTNLKKQATKPPIKNEATNRLPNNRGTIAMARTSIVDSATSEFFINLVDNDFLNHRSADARGYGYAVFGQVTAGMDVVDRIANLKTVKKNSLFQNLPGDTVIVESIRRAE